MSNVEMDIEVECMAIKNEIEVECMAIKNEIEMEVEYWAIKIERSI